MKKENLSLKLLQSNDRKKENDEVIAEFAIRYDRIGKSIRWYIG